MSAEEKLKSGDLDGALHALQDRVRKNPADAKLRVFLFQLLSVLGDWKRAITQLKVSAELDASATPMAQTYREAIICEAFREKVFAGEKDPVIFGEPPEWIAPLLEAVKAQARGNLEAASELRSRAFEAAPAIAGELNGAPFEWIADADMRLGPVLEIIVDGRYFWMPFSSLKSLTVEEPEDLRDAVWMPATITVTSGGEKVALIPTRYVGTAENGTPAQRLARETVWRDEGAETFVGHGQRVLATDQGDTALMDVRTLTFAVPPDTAGDNG
ncbi:type VI secretion system accessory protein TagJ [Tropicimonas sp. S265A]|uniref:type VI secretion system accessory protein TagJ n=1 Tax=Tropicimonas sp. S265A TaxID=3415134 RepID=UPI003C7985EB